jgi:hypothetical protein
MRAEIAQQIPPDFFVRSVFEQIQLLRYMAEKIKSENKKKRGWYDLRRQDRHAGEPSAVVTDHSVRLTSSFTDGIELAHHSPPRERSLHNEDKAFLYVTIDKD